MDVFLLMAISTGLLLSMASRGLLVVTVLCLLLLVAIALGLLGLLLVAIALGLLGLLLVAIALLGLLR